jgi:hypothetical protein
VTDRRSHARDDRFHLRDFDEELLVPLVVDRHNDAIGRNADVQNTKCPPWRDVGQGTGDEETA